jgi:peptide/nickel transport system substrate-binding protein
MKRLRLLFKHETIALSPNNFNSDSSSATAILKMVCQGLVKIGFDGQLAPDLAKSWAISDDQRIYQFKLDPKARFHTGRPCNADAVVWNFRRLLDEKSDSLLGRDYDGLEEVVAIDPHCVEFRFSLPNIAFLHNLAWRTYIVDDTFDQPAGSGPFVLSKWVRDSHLILRRSDSHRTSDAAEVSELEVRFAPSVEERLEVIRRGGADIVESVPASAVAELEQSGLLCTRTAPSQHRSVIYFNCREAPFDQPQVRRAVAHAINRDALVKEITGSTGRVVDGILHRDDPLAADVDPIAYDPVRARAILHEAGFGGGMRIRAASTNTAPFPKVAEMIAQDLRNVGIDLDFTGYDDPPWWPYMYLKGGWQLVIQGTPARPHLDTLLSRELSSDGAFNAGHYSNTELDELVKRARQTTDFATQKDIYAAVQAIVQKDLPLFSLFAMDTTVGWRPGVRGFEPHPTGLIDVSRATITGG